MSAALPDQSNLIAVIITVVSRLRSARRTAQSFLRHNPTSTAKIVVVDDWLGEARESLGSDDLHVLSVDEIEFNDNRELFRLALAWEPEEFWRALRPAIVATVLRRGRTIDARTAVIVLPDDSEVERDLPLELRPHFCPCDM